MGKSLLRLCSPQAVHDHVLKVCPEVSAETSRVTRKTLVPAMLCPPGIPCARRHDVGGAQPPGVPAIQSGLPSPLKGRKELPETLRAQTGERLE